MSSILILIWFLFTFKNLKNDILKFISNVYNISLICRKIRNKKMINFLGIFMKRYLDRLTVIYVCLVYVYCLNCRINLQIIKIRYFFLPISPRKYNDLFPSSVGI